LPRPWSTAATKAARRLFGRQALQIQLQLQAQAGAQQRQQQQQQQRAKSAQPYYSYSIDTRLMSRSNGCFRCVIRMSHLLLLNDRPGSCTRNTSGAYAWCFLKPWRKPNCSCPAGALHRQHALHASGGVITCHGIAAAVCARFCCCSPSSLQRTRGAGFHMLPASLPRSSCSMTTPAFSATGQQQTAEGFTAGVSSGRCSPCAQEQQVQARSRPGSAVAGGSRPASREATAAVNAGRPSSARLRSRPASAASSSSRSQQLLQSRPSLGRHGSSSSSSSALRAAAGDQLLVQAAAEDGSSQQDSGATHVGSSRQLLGDRSSSGNGSSRSSSGRLAFQMLGSSVGLDTGSFSNPGQGSQLQSAGGSHAPYR
jgi:hypothetical protein